MSTITKEWLQRLIRAIDSENFDEEEIVGWVNSDEIMELARIALASLEAEGKLSNLVASQESLGGDFERVLAENIEELYVPGNSSPPAPVSVHEAAPVAYIFKHPAGRLFWSLTDESNKGQSDVMPIYSAPVQSFVPPAIEPDYEVIKGILPTANPDEYACCIAADMWNACRAAMLQGAENAESRCTIQTAPALDSLPKNAESRCSNSPVIPDGGEHGFCQRHQDTRRLTHPYKQLLTYPPRPSTYCPKCDPEVSEWVERDKLLRQNKPDEERPYTVVMPGGCQHEWVHHVPCSRLKPEYEECYKCGVRRPYPAAPQREVK
ncbi:hypothetical protein [Enterobacter asburiae]|uniref:hypothetical protein n=1 Tax=Enterobacter asburiae TaxID=61645 RepID=UPI002A81F56A|nr:hypothetical protein [Enterobacter asburiae]